MLIADLCLVRNKQEDFFYFFSMYCIKHFFIFRPSDSTVSVDAEIKPRTVATSVFAVRLRH
jgi:hypothetical protein